MHLSEWDGKSLKDVVVLEGNKGTVSAVAFSPNGAYLTAGDVRFTYHQQLTHLTLD